MKAIEVKEYWHSSKGSDPFEKRSPKGEATKLSGMLDKILCSNLELIDISVDQILRNRISFHKQIVFPPHSASYRSEHTQQKKNTKFEEQGRISIVAPRQLNNKSA